MGMQTPGRSSAMSDINVTPMADVMIVLLIIFMVATPMILAGGVSLPDAAHGSRDQPELVVILDVSGGLRLGGDAVSGPAQLEVALREALSNRPSGARGVSLRADRSLSYDRVRDVVEACRSAGAESIALAVAHRGAP